LTQAVAGLALVVLVYVAFGAAARFGLINWDDTANFSENRHLEETGIAYLRWAWTHALLGVYQPLAWMFMGAEWRSTDGSATGLHFASLIFHAANAIVLWRLIAELLARASPAIGARRRVWGAWVAAALFAVHPLRTEVVAWASCQPYLPSALFFMLSVLAYLRAQGPNEDGAARRSWSRTLLPSFLFFVAALLCKAVAVSLPAFLLVLDVYPLARLGGERGWWGHGTRRVWTEKIPFFIVAAVGVAAAIWAKQEAGSLASMSDAGWISRIARSSYAIWFYLVKTVAPTSLRVLYATRGQVMRPVFLVAFVALVAAAVGVVRLRRRAPWLAAASAAYVVLLGANVGLVRIGTVLAADRYSYLATLPWWVLLGGLLVHLGDSKRLSRLPHALGFAALVALTLLSQRQTETWSDSVTLWRHATQLTPAPGGAFYNLGVALQDLKRVDEARDAFKTAVALDPEDANALTSLGTFALRDGNEIEGRDLLVRALASNPNQVFAHFNLGELLLEKGDPNGAIAHFQRCLEIQPSLVRARGRLDEAVAARSRGAAPP
jgi:hypothetical protein